MLVDADYIRVGYAKNEVVLDRYTDRIMQGELATRKVSHRFGHGDWVQNLGRFLKTLLKRFL
ncbi:MAG: hypothetical protein EKK42_22810 [Pseudonocardiaceae bacterium]|nr:hypothetical protein [Afipia sp.]RTL65025.1 MAG: hypothetical protein EKK42_22810 [Pseudonocardiaceae bacterium]